MFKFFQCCLSICAIALNFTAATISQAASPTVQLNRYGTHVCINSLGGQRSQSLTIWHCDRDDPHQQYQLLEQRNSTILLELQGSDHCLGAPRPELGGQVTLVNCNAQDRKQQWQLLAIPQSDFNLIRLEGSRYCLNAHRLENGAKIGLWNCDRFDNFQHWQLKTNHDTRHHT